MHVLTTEREIAWAGRLAPATAALAIFIALASALDALCTLLHLEDGGIELNPVMRLALSAGVPVFLWTKTLATGLGTALLAARQDLRLAWAGLHGLAAAYAGILAYHLTLLARHLGS